MDGKVLFFFALKNLKRHTRRTVINVISVGIPAGLLFFFISFYRGTYTDMIEESLIKYKTGHIQLQTKYFDERKIEDYISEKTVFSNYAGMISSISQDKEVTGAVERLMGAGFVGNGREKLAVMVVGCEPEHEKAISVVKQTIIEGKYLDQAGQKGLDQSDGIIIGKQVADLFGFKPGDMCYLQAQTINNSPNLLVMPVIGIYNTGFYELDKNTVFLNLKNANSLFDTGDSINKIYVFLKDRKFTGPERNKIIDKFGNKLDVKTWEYYGASILTHNKREGIFYVVFLTILIFISISTIMSTMYMNVFERIREIATLRAIGWHSWEVYRLFIIEALCIGAIGSLAGFIIGGIPTAYFTFVGIDYSQAGEASSIPIFKMICKPAYVDVLVAFVIGVVSTYLGGLAPARKASKMIISDALRTN